MSDDPSILEVVVNSETPVLAGTLVVIIALIWLAWRIHAGYDRHMKEDHSPDE